MKRRVTIIHYSYSHVPPFFGFICAEDGFLPVEFLQLELQTTLSVGFEFTYLVSDVAELIIFKNATE